MSKRRAPDDEHKFNASSVETILLLNLVFDSKVLANQAAEEHSLAGNLSRRSRDMR